MDLLWKKHLIFADVRAVTQ